MSQTPTEIVQALLKDPTNLHIVSQLVAPNATYVSLNFENQELKAIMPWAGTAKGPQAVVDTYSRTLTVGFECVFNCNSTKAATWTGSTWARSRIPISEQKAENCRTASR